jgi:hypothetical protein
MATNQDKGAAQAAKDAKKMEVLIEAQSGTSAKGDNGHGHEADGQQPEPAPEKDEPKAPTVDLPQAKAADLGAYQLTYHKPVVTLASGEQVKCEHHWGHEGEAAAKACMRKLAAGAGVKLPS